MTAEKERLGCQVADVSGNAAANATAMATRNEALQKMVINSLARLKSALNTNRALQVRLLETDLDRKKRDLSGTEERLSSLEKEYEGYKVRAASVLRKAKEESRDGDAERQAGKEAEIKALEREVDALNQKILDMR